MRSLIGLLLLAAALVPQAAHAQGAAHLAPELMTLSLASMPAGFVRAEDGPTSNAMVAGLDPDMAGKLDRWGRVAGWRTDFQRPPTLESFTAPFLVRSSVSTFTNPVGAGFYMANALDVLRAQGATEMAAERYGDASVALRLEQSEAGGPDIVIHQVGMRVGSLVALVSVAAMRGTEQSFLTARLASAQEQLLRGAMAQEPEPAASTAMLAPADVSIAAGDCPTAAPIKGNASSRIYHLPGQQAYAITKAERCFATETDAMAAGFRRAQR